MQVFGVIGDGSARLVDELVDRFDGRVAVVRSATSDGGLATGSVAETTYELSENGWHASGRDRSLGDVLDRLAPGHEYAVAVDFPDARLPQVVLGDGDPAGEVLYRAQGHEDAALDEIVTAITSTDPHETLESLVERVQSSPAAEYAGAVATFTGRVRRLENPDDEPTEHLAFEKYEGVAEERMDAIGAELEERDGVLEVLMHHRTGVLEAGEDIVFVVVLAGHRREAFRTVEDGIDRLKEEVPIFKKEVTTGGEFWVHERD